MKPLGFDYNKVERNSTMKNSLQLLIISFILSTVIYSSETLVQSGPRVGYSDMMEVSLWIQTTE